MTSLGLGASCAVTGAAFALIVLAAAMIEHPLPRSDEAVAMMAERGVAADPTLVPYVYIFDLAGGYYGSTSPASRSRRTTTSPYCAGFGTRA